MKLDFPVYNKARVLVVGDLMLDRYWYGGTSRVSPEAPVPVVKVNTTEDRIGGAGNVALNIASLGAAAALVAVVGDDDAGQSLCSRLDSAGVSRDFQVASNRPTITKLRVISRSQQLLRMDFEEPFGDEDRGDIVAKVCNLLPRVNMLVLSDYGKGVLAQPGELIDAARALSIPVLVDPKGRSFDAYRGATLLTPNIQEFEAVVGDCDSEQDIAVKGASLMSALDVQGLLITRGEHGMTLLRPQRPAVHFPARAREVFDVTGAGDTVIAVLAASLAAGEQLPESVALANIAAGLVVAKLGTASVSGPELRRAMQREQGSKRGVINVEQLLADVADARAEGETIVFTNGCFDILHAGHVGYLEQAKKAGDRLIVAVNSDDSVKRLKGEGRPINPVDRRMAVLAGLEAVDWVVSFDEDTPEKLLAEIRPDVLVKGGDYDVGSVVGAAIVTAYGGDVRVLGFVDNCSTTAIVDRVRASSAPKRG